MAATTIQTDSSSKNHINDLDAAVLANDIESAKLLLSKGVYPHTGPYNRPLPIVLAVENGYLDMAMLLLDYGSNPVMALEVAARKGKVDLIRAIASRLKRNTRKTDIYSETLSCAVLEGQTEACCELIKLGANVNHGVNTNYRATPLMLAAGTGNKKLIKALVDAGADIDVGNRMGETPLVWAACRNSPEGVAAMLEAGADPNLAKIGRDSPFIHAARICSLESIRLLLQAGADIHKKIESGRSELVDAITSAVRYWGNDFSKKETMEAIKLLYSLVDINQLSQEEKNLLLFDAAMINYIPGAVMALDAGAEINSVCLEKHTPFYIAVVNGHKEMITFLTDSGADINLKYKSKNALVAAIENGQSDIARALFEQGCTLGKGEKKKAGLMIRAAKYGYVDIIKLLAENGVSPNAAVKDGMTWAPIFYAAYQGENGSIKALAEAGADLEKTDRNNNTALYTACLRGHFETVKTLLELGADPFVTNSSGQSLLAIAADKNKGPLCKLLLSYKVDPSIADNTGTTALHYAARHGAIMMMRAMLLAGADLNAANKFGDTPMSVLKCYAADMYEKYADRLMSYSPEARHLVAEDKKHRQDFTGFEFDI